MALNLNALKNISNTTMDTEVTNKDTGTIPPDTPPSLLDNRDETRALPTTASIPNAGPKISLMRLKQSNVDTVGKKSIETLSIPQIPSETITNTSSDMKIDKEKEIMETATVDEPSHKESENTDIEAV